MSSLESAINRIAFAIFAVSLWILGLSGIAGRGFYDIFYSRYFDFGKHHAVLGGILLGPAVWQPIRHSREMPISEMPAASPRRRSVNDVDQASGR